MPSDHQLSIREIQGTHLHTPLIVPSFSSRGFMPLEPIYNALSPHASSLCLLSAFDIYYELLPVDAINVADTLFLDSGGYEGYASSELSQPPVWDVEKYHSILNKLNSRSLVIPVSFDFHTSGDLHQQIGAASRLQDEFPKLAWDFLVKPFSKDHAHVDVEEITTHASEISRFPLLGVVEEELGDSILDRARAIRRIRVSLTNAGLKTPIHVFGCLDPDLIITYSLAGADVFDGLQWLRSSLTPSGLIRFSSSVVRKGQWTESSHQVKVRYCIENLAALRALQHALGQLASGAKIDSLGICPDLQKQLSVILAKIEV